MELDQSHDQTDNSGVDSSEIYYLNIMFALLGIALESIQYM